MWPELYIISGRSRGSRLIQLCCLAAWLMLIDACPPYLRRSERGYWHSTLPNQLQPWADYLILPYKLLSQSVNQSKCKGVGPFNASSKLHNFFNNDGSLCHPCIPICTRRDQKKSPPVLLDDYVLGFSLLVTITPFTIGSCAHQLLQQYVMR